ncbi:MAG: hypothetical protein ACR2L2_06580 [Acidobacteriota bacterium]
MKDELPLNVRYYGKDEPLPVQRVLRAGSLSVTFEEGDLVRVCWGNEEILRRIYVAVRDRNWGTVPRRLTGLNVKTDPGSFEASFQMEHLQNEIDFRWKAQIQGTPQGILEFSMEGEARSTFLRGRIGFCLLHPIERCAGKSFTVERPDGSVVRGSFPRIIASQDVLPGTESMRSLVYEVRPGLGVEIRFAGDIFQMEDQRNWTDASYKTFCTPLWLPYPVEIKQGARIKQGVTLRINAPPSSRARIQSSVNKLTISVGSQPTVPIPRIGLGVASHDQPLTARELSRLRQLRLSHLRVDLKLFDPYYRSLLSRVATDVEALGVCLEAAVFVSDAAEDELTSFVKTLKELRPKVGSFLVFHTAEKTSSEKWVGIARKLLHSWNPRVRVGGGTNAYFYHLNRLRPSGRLFHSPTATRLR